MWISVNLSGEERIHNYEPHYNRLHDKWQGTNTVDAPKGTFEKFEKIYHKPSAICVETINNSNAIIQERLKIY